MAALGNQYRPYINTFLNYLIILILLIFRPWCSIRHLSSLTRSGTHAPCLGGTVLTAGPLYMSLSLWLETHPHTGNVLINELVCSFCGICFSYPLSLCTWLEHVEQALETPRCLAGRRQQQAPPLTWRPSGSAQGSRHGGRNHQMVEKSLLHSVDPMHVGGAEITDKGERLGLLTTALSAHWPSGSVGQKPASKEVPHTRLQCGAHGPCQRSPLGVAAGEELHCTVRELTFKEQAAWCPSVSCA